MTGMHHVYGKLDPAQEKQPVHTFSPGVTINGMNDQICMTGQASNIQIFTIKNPQHGRRARVHKSILWCGLPVSRGAHIPAGSAGSMSWACPVRPPHRPRPCAGRVPYADGAAQGSSPERRFMMKSFVSATITLDSSSSAIRLGTAIRPLKTSEAAQTSPRLTPAPSSTDTT